MIPRLADWRRLLTLLLGLLLLWAPLPFASVTPLTRALVQSGAFLALALAALALRDTSELRPVALPAGALVAIGGLGLLTSLRWPVGVARVLSPEHVELSLRAGAALDTEFGSAVALSLASETSRSAAQSWIAAAALLVAAAVAGRVRRMRRWLVGSFIASALVQVALGLRARFGELTTVWGRADTLEAGRLRGTFVNPNHAALYLTLAVVVGLGLLLLSLAPRRRPAVPANFIRYLAPASFLMASLVALSLTGSRAGWIAALTGITVVVVLAAGRWGWWLIPAGLGALLAVSLLLVATIPGSGLERILLTSWVEFRHSYRMDAWAASIELWSRFPLLGTGMGSFREAFPLVQPTTLVRESWYHAHNDWLEVLVTGGVAAAAILVVGLTGLVARLAVIVRSAETEEDRVLGATILGALAAVAVHEALDFGLTIPANWTTVAVLLGLTLGVRVRTPLDRRGEPDRE